MFPGTRWSYCLTRARRVHVNTNHPGLVIVEGVLDAIAITEAGKGAMVGVASCGTALTRAHVECIDPVACGPVAVAYDPDQAGRKATARSWKTLHAAGIDAIQADLPGGADPALTIQLHGPAVLTEAITARARPLVQAALQAAIEPWVDQLDEVEARVAAMRSTIGILAQLEPIVAADQMVRSAG